MKATLFFLVCLMGFGYAGAQEVNCVEKQKELAQFVKDGKYKQASELLPLLRKKCTAPGEEFYQLGITTLKYNADMATADGKEQAIRELMKFYDQYDASFPKNKNGNTVKKAMLLYSHKIGTEQEVYVLLDKAFTSNPSQFTEGNPLFVYFKMYAENYTNKKGNISLEQLLSKYNDIQVAIETNRASNPDKVLEFNNAAQAAKGLMKKILDPESVIPVAEKNFEANKQNTEWLSAMASLLADKSAGTAIFGKIATQLNELKPNSQSAYYLGSYHLKNKNTSQAIAYFDKAAELAERPFEKAKIYYNTASMIANSDKALAKKMLKLAMQNNPKNGSYYILLASMYANSVEECSQTKLEQKAIYQLAGRTAELAGVVEPRMKATAAQYMAEYGKNSPTKAELDEIKKSGGKVKVGCWIEETVSF